METIGKISREWGLALFHLLGLRTRDHVCFYLVTNWLAHNFDFTKTLAVDNGYSISRSPPLPGPTTGTKLEAFQSAMTQDGHGGFRC